MKTKKEYQEILRNAINSDLNSLTNGEILDTWKSIAFLYPQLHPDESDNPDGGWNNNLMKIAVEFFKRQELGEISSDEIYQPEEQIRGLESLNRKGK